MELTTSLIDCRSGEEGRRDRISDLHILVRAFSAFFLPLTAIHDDQHLTGFHNAVSRILKATPPADAANPFMTVAPRTSVPPIQLFHPVFGHFLDDVKSCSRIPDDATLGSM